MRRALPVRRLSVVMCALVIVVVAGVLPAGAQTATASKVTGSSKRRGTAPPSVVFEEITQAVAGQVGGEGEHEHSNGWGQRNPWMSEQVGHAAGGHGAKLGRWRRRAKPDER